MASPPALHIIVVLLLSLSSIFLPLFLPFHFRKAKARSCPFSRFPTLSARENMTAAGEGEREHGDDEQSVERMFDCQEVPPWTQQLTLRSLAVSAILGFFLSFIVMKLNLTAGIIPSLNVSAGLLGFFMVKTWTTLLEKTGLLNQPFTRQENTVIQTCVVACSGIAFSGG